MAWGPWKTRGAAHCEERGEWETVSTEGKVLGVLSVLDYPITLAHHRITNRH